MPSLDQLKARKALLEKRIARIKAQQNSSERRADLHLKASLGGAVLIALENPNVPATIKIYLLKQADGGLQKKGIARQRYEGLQAKYVLAREPSLPQAIIL